MHSSPHFTEAIIGWTTSVCPWFGLDVSESSFVTKGPTFGKSSETFYSEVCIFKKIQKSLF